MRVLTVALLAVTLFVGLAVAPGTPAADAQAPPSPLPSAPQIRDQVRQQTCAGFAAVQPAWLRDRLLQQAGCATAPPEAPATTATFGCTRAPASYTVPAGVTRISIDAEGGHGGSPGAYLSGVGAPGGRVLATVPVTPGQQMTVLVGCAGGRDGGFGHGVGGHGGSGRGAGRDGGGGGGGSAVLAGMTPLVVAGGGGGGGAGGFADAAPNPNLSKPIPGGAGGAGGNPADAGTTGHFGGSGGCGGCAAAINGDRGENCDINPFGGGAGGGGGGARGGGKGHTDHTFCSAGGGGGGLSAVTAAATYHAYLTSNRGADGLVRISLGAIGARVFDCTKRPEAFTVPAGVTRLDVEATGAHGATPNHGANYNVAHGGAGGIVRATIQVAPGQMLRVTAGCTDGFGGGRGGRGGHAPVGFDGGHGGGSSEVASPTSAPLVVAGGGGGGGGAGLSSGAGRGGDGGLEPQRGAGGGGPGGSGGCGGCEPGPNGTGGGHAHGLAGGGGGGGGGYHGGRGGGSGNTVLGDGGGGGGGGRSYVDPGASIAGSVSYGTSLRPGSGIVVLIWQADAPGGP